MGLVVADTNIFVYLLNGDIRIDPYLDNEFIVSDITEIELLGVKNISEKDKKVRRELLDNCFPVAYNNEIKEIAIALKQKIAIKIPDALIAATAIKFKVPLLTVDKDFKKVPGLSLILVEF